MVQINVMDEDVGTDDHVGSGSYSLNNVYKTGKEATYVDVNWKGKNVGKVWVEFSFIAEGAPTTHGTV